MQESIFLTIFWPFLLTGHVHVFLYKKGFYLNINALLEDLSEEHYFLH